MQRIFLDHNSTTRPAPNVIEAVATHLRESFANPGSRHADGRVARRTLEDARERITRILDAEPQELIFTSGGTESINLAILGLAPRESGVALLTAGEHPATREAYRRLEECGWKLRFLDVDAGGRMVVENLDQLPWNEIKLATIILAHNETGVLQDVSPLAEKCRRFHVPLHIDAVQAVGKVPVHFHQLAGTALSFAAHKFHGPRGIGALLLRKGVHLRPRQLGGHQEAGLRSGTESVALAVGMAVALENFERDRVRREAHLRELRDRLERGLESQCSPTVVNGSRAHRLPNTLSIAFPGVDGEGLLVGLDLAGVSCSLGSACASGSMQPSPVLVAMGCSPEVCASSVRFSLSCDNTREEIDEAVSRVAACVRRLRALKGERPDFGEIPSGLTSASSVEASLRVEDSRNA